MYHFGGETVNLAKIMQLYEYGKPYKRRDFYVHSVTGVSYLSAVCWCKDRRQLYGSMDTAISGENTLQG